MTHRDQIESAIREWVVAIGRSCRSIFAIRRTSMSSPSPWRSACTTSIRK